MTIPFTKQVCRIRHSQSQSRLHFYARTKVEVSKRRVRICRCAAAPKSVSTPKKYEDLLKKPPHERFDEAYISVQGGKGGQGEIWQANKPGARGRRVKNFKYKSGGHQPKTLFLPASAPSQGAEGGHVFLQADERYNDLLHLHKRYAYKAKDGGNAIPATAQKSNKQSNRLTPKLVLPVPVGTAVFSKKDGLLAEFLTAGERVLIARGGDGGRGVQEPKPLRRRGRSTTDSNSMVVDMFRSDWKVDAQGKAGEILNIKLILRIVADIGLVGLPNVGKSTLLSILTRAKPEVADYPFTTLVPNLGVIGSDITEDGDDWNLEDEQELLSEEFRTYDAIDRAVIADLPGLIQDAHIGKGLGRVFLRHLKRTRLICHLVDLTSTDPLADYLSIRDELRMYNPDYVQKKPHIIVFSKGDLVSQELNKEEFIQQATQSQQGESLPPVDVVQISSKTGEGIEHLMKVLSESLNNMTFQ